MGSCTAGPFERGAVAKKCVLRDHVAPRKSCANSIVEIKSESEDALGIADVSTMTDTAKPRIGAWREVLNILRFSLWNLPRDDKGVAGTGGNGDYLTLIGIKPSSPLAGTR